MQEVARLEAVYHIEAKGDLLLFLYTMGINQAGVIPSLPAMHGTMPSYLNAMTNLRELLEEYDRPDLAEGVFAFDFDDEFEYYLFYSKYDGGVYYLDNSMDSIEKTYESISDMLEKSTKGREKHGIEYLIDNDDCIRLFHFESVSLF